MDNKFDVKVKSYNPLLVDERIQRNICNQSTEAKSQIGEPKIIWQPFKYFLCIPCIGHIGLKNSQDTQYDFRNDNFVGVDVFGGVAKEFLLNKCDGYKFDEAVQQIKSLYEDEYLEISSYSFFCNNCHHFVKNVINLNDENAKVSGLSLFCTMLFKSKRVGKYKGFIGWFKLYGLTVFLCMSLFSIGVYKSYDSLFQ